MQKRLSGYMLLILILAACAPPTPTGQPVVPTDGYSSASPSSDFTDAEHAAIEALSRALDLPAETIAVVSIEAVTWPDDCLGVYRAGVQCTPAPVKGARIVLAANDQEYVYHTDQHGSTIILANLERTVGPVEETVKNQLSANLGLDIGDISVVRNSEVVFEDSCLGVPMKDVKCAPGQIPGQIIVLQAHGVHYEYHVRDHGIVIQPATLALLWTRQGGASGFCDSLTVFRSGEVYASRCDADPDRIIATLADLLSKDELVQFDAWIREFGPVDLEASDFEGVSDRTEITVSFRGIGTGMPDQSTQRALLLWIQNLFSKLYS